MTPINNPAFLRKQQAPHPYLISNYINYSNMKPAEENPVDASAAAEVRAEQPKKPSKPSSRQKLVPIEDLDPDAPRSVFQDRSWNKELKQH